MLKLVHIQVCSYSVNDKSIFFRQQKKEVTWEEKTHLVALESVSVGEGQCVV